MNIGTLLDYARRIKNSSTTLRGIYAWLLRFRVLAGATNGADADYAARLAKEENIYRDVANINDLPRIFHYWSHTYVRPMLEEFGVSNPDQFFAKYLAESARSQNIDDPVFISLGAGNCDTEVRAAKLMRDAGLLSFRIECLDMNPAMLERGRALAAVEGLVDHIIPVRVDFNAWRATKDYAGVMANQALHHMLKLEDTFDEVKRCLAKGGYFVVSDMIGRNGHQRWPEALAAVREFWKELPPDYRYNRPLKRQEDEFMDWDCSTEGFEGIRAQHILPLLIERFHFPIFVGFANVVDPFVDRCFGHHFNADATWDRELIDRIHAYDEAELKAGRLTPTHMMAVMSATVPPMEQSSRGLTPRASIRSATV
jgi:SAM-dependent methyltransferase